ncbi:MAG: hypothetical protein ACRDZ5_10370, partial [Acidimicrobiales bacterium]
MTTADIERLDEAKAFSATLSFEALERFHVPFDDLIGNDATEGRLGPLVRQGRRVAVRAASGEGKSSLITSVLGPLAIGEESPIFAIPVPVAGAADDTVTSSEAFFRYLLNVLARWSDRTELERRDRRRLDRLERDLRDRQETRHAGVTIPLWFLQPDLARDITTTVSAIGDYADALGTLRRAVELLRTAGKQPIVVFDDTDAWLQSVELDRKRLASGFFGGPFRTLAKDVDVGIVIAVHNSYADVPEYLAARELLDATIEVPRFDGRSHAAFTKILGQRVRQQLGDGVLLAELVETDAIEQVARFYQAGTG